MMKQVVLCMKRCVIGKNSFQNKKILGALLNSVWVLRLDFYAYMLTMFMLLRSFLDIHNTCVCSHLKHHYEPPSIFLIIANEVTKSCHLKTATVGTAISQDGIKAHYLCNCQCCNASSITVTSTPPVTPGLREQLNPQ